MKKNIALILALLVVGTAFAGPKPRKNSRTEMGIHGNAIYVIEYTYNLRGGRDGGRQLICIDSITFDKRGNFADKFRTKADDYTWYSYFFDVNGYSLGWNEYNREKMLTGRTAYLNDRDGNRIERTVFLGNQMTKKESSTFKNGQKVEEQSFDETGEMTEKRTYKYDQKGNCTEMEFYIRRPRQPHRVALLRRRRVPLGPHHLLLRRPRQPHRGLLLQLRRAPQLEAQLRLRVRRGRQLGAPDHLPQQRALPSHRARDCLPGELTSHAHPLQDIQLPVHVLLRRP